MQRAWLVLHRIYVWVFDKTRYQIKPRQSIKQTPRMMTAQELADSFPGRCADFLDKTSISSDDFVGALCKLGKEVK